MAFGHIESISNSGNASSATGTLSAAPSLGNLVMAYVNRNDSIAISNDAGGSAWLELVQETPPPGETASHALFWKIAGASEPSSYSWTLNGTDDYHVIIRVFSSATDAIVASYNTAVESVNEQNMVCNAIDGEIIGDDELSVVFIGKDRSQAAISFTTATPTDYIGEIGDTGGRFTASAYKIYTTGTTFSGDVDIAPASTVATDLSYSIHVAFKESTAGPGLSMPVAMYHRRQFNRG